MVTKYELKKVLDELDKPPITQQVRDEFYPKDGLMVDRISGLDAVMADGVANRFLAAPLTKEQLDRLFRVPAPVK